MSDPSRRYRNNNELASEFEGRIRELFRLQGWDVKSEILVGHKNVDGLISRRDDFGRLRSYGLEVKRYARRLSRIEVSRIYADYMGLISSRLIDGLVLISLKGLSPSAITYCDELDDLIHLTERQLSNQLMDFSGLIAGVLEDYGSELKDVYVEQHYKTANGKRQSTLETDLIQWIQSEDQRPRAVLASYGMGKSTLARRLAYLLADTYQRTGEGKIPVLISLDAIATDQSLEGLLGRYFTSYHLVSNYNFSLFQKLNSCGQFVILLDGFDEMKQTMTWESMRYNFQQLHRLIKPASKVIIFGRPTAFLNRDEFLEAIHGQRKIGRKRVAIPGWPDYEEIKLQPLDRRQIDQFVSSHLIHQGQDNFDRSLLGQELLEDLARRPVQLKMLLEVLPVLQGPIDELSTALLYSEFIDLVIRREMKKRTRQRFGLKQRRDFAKLLAFWLWNERHQIGVEINDLPDEIFDPFFSKDLDNDAVRRDLLSACFLEMKEPQGIYFSHRSFLEFLVAECLADFVSARAFGAEGISRIEFVNPEIVEFFVALLGEREILSWHRHMLTKWEGSLNDAYLVLFSAACEAVELEVTKKDLNRISGRKNNPVREISSRHFFRDTKPRKSPHKKAGVTRKKNY